MLVVFWLIGILNVCFVLITDDLVKKDAASGNSVWNYVFCGLEDMANPLLV
jgi:hypothetical protein